MIFSFIFQPGRQGVKGNAIPFGNFSLSLSPFSTATITSYFVTNICTFSFRLTPFPPNADLAIGVFISDLVIPPDRLGP